MQLCQTVSVFCTIAFVATEFNHFEAKIHDLREQMMNSTTGSLVSSTGGGATAAPVVAPPTKKTKTKQKSTYVKYVTLFGIISF